MWEVIEAALPLIAITLLFVALGITAR